MNEYVYQIQGALEDSNGRMQGFRVLVCNLYYFDSADVPRSIFDKETVKYIEFRLKVCEYLDINKLPVEVQNRIRAPLGRWLDQWVLNNFYGNSSKSKSPDPGLLEAGKQDSGGGLPN
jgi:hypothetical protein